MEANGSSSNSTESQPSGGSNNSSTEKPNEKEIFVNHGMSKRKACICYRSDIIFPSRTVLSLTSLPFEQLFWNVVKLMLNLIFSSCMGW